MSEKKIKIICAVIAAFFFILGLVYYVHRVKLKEDSILTPSKIAYPDKNAEESDIPREAEFPIDINSVTLEELIQIKGVGYELAGKILDYRAEQGVIHDLNELTQIDGIGERTVEKLSEYLFVSDKDYIAFTTATTTVPTTTAAATTKAKTTTAAPKSTTTRRTTTAAASVKTTTTTVKPASFPIDINLVTFDELIQINGVGEHTADSILELRRQKGKITDLEQLLEIDGIGQAKYEMLCGYLFVSERDYSKASTATVTTTGTTTAGTTRRTTTAKTTSRTSSVSSAEEEKQMRRVNISTASAEEIADCLLIEPDMADEIVELRENIGYFSNTLELLYIEDLDKRFNTAFYNSIKDYVYIDEPPVG